MKARMGWLEWLMLLGLAGVWGGSFFLSKLAVVELPPFVIVFGRTSIASLALLLVVRLTGNRLPTDAAQWRAFAVMGIINNIIPFSLIFWGQIYIASGLASILNASTPLWTVLLAHLFTRDEKLTVARLLGVLIGLVGVGIIIGSDVLSGLGSNLLAQLAIVGAAVSYAVAGIYGKRFRGVSPYVTAAGQVTCTSVLMIPIVLLVNPPWTLAMPSPGVIAAVVTLGLVCTAAAYVIYFRLLATAGATNAVLVTLLVPVSAMLLGRIFLAEAITWQQALGMVTIFLGLMVIDGRLPALLRRAAAPVPSGGD